MPAAQPQRPGNPMQAPQEDPGRRSARHRSHSPRRCRRRDPARSPRAHGCRGRRSSPCRGSRRQCSWSPPDGGQERSRSHSCRRHRRNRVAPLSTWPQRRNAVELRPQPKCRFPPASAAQDGPPESADRLEPVPGTVEEKRVVAALLLAEAEARELEEELVTLEGPTDAARAHAAAAQAVMASAEDAVARAATRSQTYGPSPPSCGVPLEASAAHVDAAEGHGDEDGATDPPRNASMRAAARSVTRPSSTRPRVTRRAQAKPALRPPRPPLPTPPPPPPLPPCIDVAMGDADQREGEKRQRKKRKHKKEKQSKQQKTARRRWRPRGQKRGKAGRPSKARWRAKVGQWSQQ